MKRKSFWISAFLGLVGGVVVGLPQPRNPEFAVLAVGQGDCSLIIRDHVVIMIDCGPAGVGFDPAGRIIVPELRRRNIGRIDALILTHPDQDHTGGIDSLLNRVQIGQIVMSSAFRDHPQIVDIAVRARQKGVKMLFVEGLATFKSRELSVSLYPPPLVMGSDDNSASLFVFAQNGSRSMVWAGDAPESSENSMISSRNWKADYLFASHHGSRDGNSASWIDAVNPTSVAISCGANNPYRHPHPEVIERFVNRGVDVLRTDRGKHLSFPCPD